MAETQSGLACPPVGHKTFEKSLKFIRFEDADTPQQISKFVRPALCLTDELGAAYVEGELQRRDLDMVRAQFLHPQFIRKTFKDNLELFRVSQCRIYQFQTLTQRGKPFCFGIIITDSQHNLIDYCVDTHQVEKRRPVLMRLIRAICTPSSVARKLSH